MTLARLLSAYCTLNLLLLLAVTALFLFSICVRQRRRSLSAATELKLHYAVISALLALTIVHPFLPRNDALSPAARVWAAHSFKSFPHDFTSPGDGGYLSVPTPIGVSMLHADHVTILWGLLAALLLIWGGRTLYRDLARLLKTRKDAFCIRRIGRVRMYASSHIHVPFSYWLPGQANVFVPTTLLERHREYRMAVVHELQHHRNGDTRWVYVVAALRLLCVLNPAIHWWNRWLSELQEFACDETLVDQRKVESQAYARCLVEVAQTAINQARVPVCATGFLFLTERNLLKRRIEKMLGKSSKRTSTALIVGFGVLLTTVMGVASFASSGLIQDRRVTMAQAELMASKARNGSDFHSGIPSGFPVVVNDQVLKQLNRYIGTPEGREIMRKALQRMENFEATIGEYLRKYAVPVEIMAIPLIESGFRNLSEPESGTPMKAAGIWQFIPSTARVFGLRVDNQKDERLDIGLSTDAALRLLLSDKLRFNDWHLSVLAYNAGETKVQQGIDATGSRDAWTLIRNGYEGDKDYLPKVLAAILIMRNPESVE